MLAHERGGTLLAELGVWGIICLALGAFHGIGF